MIMILGFVMELNQIVQWKVDCPNFGHVRNWDIT